MLSPNDSWQTPICRLRKRLLSPIFCGDRLIDRRSAGAAAREHFARDQAAHRVVMAVARPRQPGRRIIDAAENMNVLAESRQRLQARRHFEIAAVLARNPVLFDDPVAVEPEDEARLDRLVAAALGGIGRAAGVELRLERRQARRVIAAPDRPMPRRNVRRESCVFAWP